MLQLDAVPTGDGVKADRFPRLAGRLSGSMMELQTLQDALKVEIQIHQKLVAQMKQDPQNADLKKQLHELQAKITALSEKQKKVVEQLRKELMVKQEPEKLQLQVQSSPAGVDKQPILLQNIPCQTTPQGVLQQTLTVTPVLTTKTLPLVLKAATTPASVLPQRPATVAMVTTAITAAKPESQSTPINLQVAGRLANQGSEPVRLSVSKNAVVVQATTTSSAQPIKVPQFVPPPRLTPRPTYQPQVRPKPATPTNVPIAPAPPPPMMAAPQLLQRPVMLATKLSASSLPSSAAPIHQVRIVNGQPCSPNPTPPMSGKTMQTTPLTGIVIATAVPGISSAAAAATRLVSAARPAPKPTPKPAPSSTKPIQISSLGCDTKTVKVSGGAERKIVVSRPSSSSTPPLSPPPVAPPRPKREENPQKLAFMVSLGLVTHDHLEEIQSRRQERKRRTTANPVYSGAVFEPERKKTAVSYLNSPLHQGTRKRGRPPKYSGVPEPGTPPLPPPPGCNSASSPAHHHHHPLLPPPSPATGDGDIHEDFCTVCRRSGQLLMCDTCSRVFHLDCLDPPLKTIPKGMWICPKCQDQILKKEEAIPWPGTLAIVHSYIAYKEAKEEEKLKLGKWSSELKLEREQLEQRVKLLSNSITKCMETKNGILSRQKEMQFSLDKVKHLVRLIQAFNFNQALGESQSQGPDIVRAQGPDTARALGPDTARALGPDTARALGPYTASAQGPDTARAQGPDTARAQGPDTARAHGPDTARAQEPDTARAHGPDTARAQGPDTARAQVPDTARAQVPDTARAQVPDTARAQVPDTARAQVPDTARAQVPDTARAQGPDTARAQGPDAARAQVPDAARAQVPDAARAQVPDTARAQVPDTARAQVPDTARAQVPDTAKAQGHDTARAQGPDAATAQGPDTARSQSADTARVPGTDTARVPGTDTARVPGADIAMVPGADTARVPGADTARGQGTDTARGQGADTARGQGADTARGQGADTASAHVDDTASVHVADTARGQESDMARGQDTDTARGQEVDTARGQSKDVRVVSSVAVTIGVGEVSCVGGASYVSDEKADGERKEEEEDGGAESSSQTGGVVSETGGGDSEGKAPPQEPASQSANSPARVGLGVGLVVRVETEAGQLANPDPGSSLVAVTVATTNGCSDSGSSHTPNISDTKMAAGSPETVVETKQEEVANGNNGKTSEPSQHSLPALLSSADSKK